MERSLNILIYLVITFIALQSCSSESKKPDVSGIDLAIKIERFDQEFAKLDSQDILSQNRIWQKKYADFYSDYMLHMLQVGSPADTLYMKDILSKIIKEQDFKALSQAVNEAFPNLKKQEEELTLAFKYVKHYFPDYQMPKIISFFSGFTVQVPVGNDYVGIGLDMFLGSNSPFYPALIQSVPLYISRRFTPENITPRVIESVLREELIPEKDMSSNTLQQMIHHGKIMYSMDCVLDAADSLKIGYTSQQMEWANQYEGEIWSWFLEEDLLYSNDYQRIQKYFTEAPFTPELGEHNSSAPKLGTYIGWQIVKKYMDKHPEFTLNDLLKEENAQKILEGSKYKGKSST